MNVEFSRCWWFGREKAVTACALSESTDLEKISLRYKINSRTGINEIKILRNYIWTILKSNLKSVIHYCR